MTSIYILVGTNPIPCYISAVYLLDYYHAERELFFVCSEDNPSIKQAGTYRVGEKIQKQIKMKFPDLPIKLLEISDVASEQAISAALMGSCSDSNEIHLNYTGGTKSMAAITYNILKSREGFSSSYLDVRRHIMIMDGDPAGSDDLRENPKLKLDLQAITTLHGFDQVEDNYTDDAYQNLMEELKKLLLNGVIHQIYGQGNLKKKTPETIAREDEEIRQQTEEIIKASGIREAGIDDKHINKYIDGPWLEHYLYDELRESAKDIMLYYDVNKQDHFQIDLIALYGYQMTLISATTDSCKGLSKLKAFEAIHRAHQLGGDEAKSIMVTLMKTPKSLEEDIRGSFGSTIPGFRAFGINDFLNNTIFGEIVKYVKE